MSQHILEGVILLLIFPVLAVLMMPPFLESGQTSHILPAGFQNSPGLSCRTIGLSLVYQEPSLSAKVLGRTQNFVAVTGQEVNGFLPMVTGKKVRGWVQARETFIGKPGEVMGPCVVQVQPDGRLLFGWP